MDRAGGFLVQKISHTGTLKNYVTDDLKKYLQVYTWKGSSGFHPRLHRI
jgi:hypothetical protein